MLTMYCMFVFGIGSYFAPSLGRLSLRDLPILNCHSLNFVLFMAFSGGTDIISCFAGNNSTLPVFKGEIQCRLLGMAIESWNDEGLL